MGGVGVPVRVLGFYALKLRKKTPPIHPEGGGGVVFAGFLEKLCIYSKT